MDEEKVDNRQSGIKLACACLRVGRASRLPHFKGGTMFRRLPGICYIVPLQGGMRRRSRGGDCGARHVCAIAGA